MNDFVVEESISTYGAKIKVIGVGGGGGNMINHIVREKINELNGMQSVDLIAANTDIQALNASLATHTIQLGEKKTRGLGAGAIPEVGRESAEESYNEIKELLEGTDIVFISSGFGGGTGTGAAPVVARAAKESGALTVAVVTLPFNFEGKKRRKLAEEGIKELRKECDTVIIIPNEKLRGIAGVNMGFKDCFKIVDQVLAKSVSGIAAIILQSGEGINLDFADVKTTMSYKGLSLMSIGEAEGEGAAQEAIKNATQSPLLESVDLKSAKAAIVGFKFHPNYPFSNIEAAMQSIQNDDDDIDEENINIFFGVVYDENMSESKVEVTIIATGFVDSAQQKESESPFQKVSGDNYNIPRKTELFDLDNLDEKILDTPSWLRNKQD